MSAWIMIPWPDFPQVTYQLIRFGMKAGKRQGMVGTNLQLTSYML